MLPAVLHNFIRGRAGPWLAVAIIALGCGAIRWRLLDLPLERDEGEYAYAGSLLLQGVPPYQSAYNMKFPGTYLAYAAVMAIFGETVRGVHLGVILITTIGTVLAFLVARKLLDAVAGVAAAWTFGFLSVNPSLFGLAGHATHLVNLFFLAAVWFGLQWRERGGAGRALAAGACLGFAVLMKQHALFLGALGLGLFLWPRPDLPQPSRAARRTGALLFGFGVMIPLALLVAWLAWAGVLDRFLFWTITYARQYVATIPLSLAPVTFAEMATEVLSPSWPVWTWAMLAMIAGLSVGATRRRTLVIACWLVLAFAALCPGFVFRHHYFLLLVPPVALLTGLSASLLVAAFRQRGERRQAALVLGAGFAMAHALAVGLNWDNLLTTTPAQLARRMYGNQGFGEAVEVASFLRTHTASTERIGVLGSEPEIFFLAGRRSVTGHIYTYALMEPQPFARQMQREMIHDFEQARPAYIVVAHHAFSWLRRPDSDESLFEWWEKFQPGYYEPAGFVDIGLEGPLSCWSQIENCPRPTPNGFTVYRRKDAPAATAPP